jgi:hypothetical protein
VARSAPEEILSYILEERHAQRSLPRRAYADSAAFNSELQRRAELREEITEAARAGDWATCLVLLPEPCRLWAFLDAIQYRVTDADYWETLGGLWIEAGSPRRDRSRLLGLFSSPRGERDHLMDASELARYRAFPPVVELYRGAIPRYARGMSWTQDLEEAAWWAQRFAVGGRFGAGGNLYQATVDRAAVLACFNERNESELVIDPRLLPPLRAMRWTREKLDGMAERVKQRKQTRGFL